MNYESSNVYFINFIIRKYETFHRCISSNDTISVLDRQRLQRKLNMSIHVRVCICFKLLTFQHTVSRLMNCMYSKKQIDRGTCLLALFDCFYTYLRFSTGLPLFCITCVLFVHNSTNWRMYLPSHS